MPNVSVMCDPTQKICLIGVLFEICTLFGLSINIFLILIFLKNRYHQNDPALILSLSLLFCDCGHLLLCVVHVGPELIVDFEVEKVIDPVISFAIFYFWVANLFHLAYICYVRYNATCQYEKFKVTFTKVKIFAACCWLWFFAGLICILPLLHYVLHLPIFNINISLLEDLEYKRKDYYLEYILHFLHASLILWMTWAYSKCIIHMKRASKRVIPGILGTLMAAHQRRNFRICVNYILITVLFLVLIVTWLMFELIGSTWITVCLKKSAYIANSISPAIIFLATNSLIKRDTAAVFSGYRNSIIESVSKIKDWKIKRDSNVETIG